MVLYTILTTIKINRFWKRNCGYILHLYQKKLLTHFGRKCWHWRLTLWYPCLLQVFGFDNFSNTMCQTSLNNVCKGTTVLHIISLSELTKMQWQVENIEKSKKLYIFLLFFIFFSTSLIFYGFIFSEFLFYFDIWSY